MSEERKHRPRGILVVDDDEDHIQHVERRLKATGILNPVVGVTTAQEAFEYMRGKGRFKGVARPRPAVILLDIMLPDAHGSEFLEFLKNQEKTKDTPVVVLTDSDTTQSPTILRKYGADGLIEKPLSVDSFNRAMEPIGTDWLVYDKDHKDGDGIEVETMPDED